MLKKSIKIGRRLIGNGLPVYIISEVGSNFDGDLKRLKKLAKISKEIGADCFKIQNFLAEKIVSDEGFKNFKVAHQARWKDSVFNIYKKAEFPRKWLDEISDYCKQINIDFSSAPYDTEAVDLLKKLNLPYIKLGSGEIDNLEFLKYVAKFKKPIFMACGSSTVQEVDNAIKAIRSVGNNKIVLMQCVTNYPTPIADTNLNAMVNLGKKFNVLVGYSDHTTSPDGGGDDPLRGLTVPLGAVALGAVAIEKHFTDDTGRLGPDHPFAMDIGAFSEMVKGVRAMEKALGDGIKKIMPSEKQTVIIQRRGVYAIKSIEKGTTIKKDDIELLRPAVGVIAGDVRKLIGLRAKHDIDQGQPIYWKDIEN